MLTSGTALALAKASLAEVANPAARVDFHFNPTTINFHRNADYTATPRQAQDQPNVQFKGTGQTRLNLTLLFDAVEKQPDGSVLPEIDLLFSWTQPASKDRDTLPRPSALRFSWGSLRIGGDPTFDCVLADVDVTYRMFSRTGLPIRADVKVQLMAVTEDGKPQPLAVPQRMSGAQNPTSGGLNAYRTHTIRGGETLQAIAYLHYADPTRWRGLAIANGIDDPIRLHTGLTLILPAANDLPVPV